MWGYCSAASGVASETGEIDCNYGVQRLPEGTSIQALNLHERATAARAERDIGGNNKGANVTLKGSQNEQLVDKSQGAEYSADGVLRHAPVSRRHSGAAVTVGRSGPLEPLRMWS